MSNNYEDTLEDFHIINHWQPHLTMFNQAFCQKHNKQCKHKGRNVQDRQIIVYVPWLFKLS